LGLALVFGVATAQENSIEAITAAQQGPNIVIKVALKNPLAKLPVGFSIANPARIALDFSGVTNATGKNSQDIGLGDVRNVNVVQAGERSRLVFNLNRSLNYATAIDGNMVVITIDGTGGLPTAVNAQGIPLPNVNSTYGQQAQAIRDIDFHRGPNGEGRVVIDLPSNQVAVDVRQQGKKIEIDFMKSTLPEVLRRRLDVADFGTPVDVITTRQQGENVRMTIEPKGLWEHSAYQSDSQLVVEVKPLKEDSNKLGGGLQSYKGEKLSLNFQSVEVRAVLQVIADFTGLNIITSDTVSGNLTLRLKDVPWDQALDIVMQAKGLDMRKNGSVIWVAPRDELLTKEKLELEQRSQIAELEPVRTESFQLNYQKAEAFKKIFGIDGDTKNSILSKRGSAVIDPRTNQLFITDIPSKLEEIRSLISKTDIPSRQVMIEARIVEANDTFSSSLGAKLAFGLQRQGGNIFEIGGQQTGTVGAAGGSAPNATGLNSSALRTVNGNSVNLPATEIGGKTPGSVALTYLMLQRPALSV
jgi:type IV pilus assembly protein PilQ